MFEWLLESNVWKRLEASIKAGVKLTDKQIETITPLAITSESDPRILSKADDKAEILVEGVLTERFDFMAYLCGGGNTTYQDIRASLALADQDETVKEAVMVFDSPGGSVAGLFDTITAIDNFSKPIKAVVRNMAASAAYALAAATDSIEATNVSVGVGSIGIVVFAKVDEDTVAISSTKAPKKAPDVTTVAGKKVVREGLDDIHALLAQSIADSRGTTVANVNASYGKGAVLLAEQALKSGMIDKIQTKAITIKPKKQTNARADSGRKEAKMDINELKAEHKATYDAVIAEGIAKGVTQERDRVGAHLTYGASNGAMETAVKAVKEGTELSQTILAEYMTAGKNNSDVANVQADAAAIAAAADNAADVRTDEEKDAEASDAIMAKALAACGVEATAK